MSSTKLTRYQKTTLPMVESRTLKLAFAFRRIQKSLENYLSEALVARGYKAASPAILNFLSELECGENHASEIARRLGVSRQMVSKTVTELCQLDLLVLSTDAVYGNQKVITFAPKGEKLMADARQILADLDTSLEASLNSKQLDKLIQSLDRIENHLGGQSRER